MYKDSSFLVAGSALSLVTATPTPVKLKFESECIIRALDKDVFNPLAVTLVLYAELSEELPSELSVRML